MLKLLAATAALFALLAPSAAAWQRPVDGSVARGFSYSRAQPFRRGWHRGVSLAARPGTTVHAACAGRVVTATWDVVTIRCGPWRVSHLPLGSFRVRPGAKVREGAAIGTLARGHAALYVSVREAGDRFAYVDPLSLLPPPGAPRAPVPFTAPRDGDRRPAPITTIAPSPIPRSAPSRSPRPAPIPRREPGRSPRPAPISRVRVPARRPLAPWPVWAGLALALTGAIGGGIGVRVRRGRVAPEAVASAP